MLFSKQKIITKTESQLVFYQNNKLLRILTLDINTLEWFQTNQNELILQLLQILHFGKSTYLAKDKQNSNQIMIRSEETMSRNILTLFNRQFSNLFLGFFLFLYNYFEISKRMKFFDKLSSFIKINDIFYSSELLRYQKQNQYQTVTGGFLSLGIWVTIIVSFASMILQTFNLTNITSQQTIIKQNNPPKMQIKMQKGSNFMFGMRMIDLNQQIFNLNDEKRYFDIYLTKVYFKSGLVINFQNIPLEQCTKDHWSDFPHILSNYDSLMMDYWLCPPKDTIIDLQGMYTSQYSSTVAFRIVSCNNYTNVNNICASPQQIVDLMTNRTNFSVNLYFTNPVINPNMKDYIDYYLQQQANAIFSSSLGSQTLIYLADYTITSDNSYWPFESVEKQYGSILDGSVINRPFTVDQANPVYANIVMFKSSASFMIKREVQKISSVFSYIGGFFGALTAALFIIKAYTDSAFQFSLATNLFQRDLQENSEQQQKETFHLFKFIGMKIYAILLNFGMKNKWQKINKILQEQQEVKNHLNIVSLLRRMIAMEDYLTYLFQDYQIEGIKMQKNKTLNHIRQLRKKFSQYQDDQQMKFVTNDMKIADADRLKQQFKSKQQSQLSLKNQNSAKPIILIQKQRNAKINLGLEIRNEREDVQSIDVLNLGNQVPFSLACEVVKEQQSEIIDKANEILNKLKESSACNSISQKILSRIPQKYKKLT